MQDANSVERSVAGDRWFRYQVSPSLSCSLAFGIDNDERRQRWIMTQQGLNEQLCTAVLKRHLLDTINA